MNPGQPHRLAGRQDTGPAPCPGRGKGVRNRSRMLLAGVRGAKRDRCAFHRLACGANRPNASPVMATPPAPAPSPGLPPKPSWPLPPLPPTPPRPLTPFVPPPSPANASPRRHPSAMQATPPPSILQPSPPRLCPLQYHPTTPQKTTRPQPLARPTPPSHPEIPSLWA